MPTQKRVKHPKVTVIEPRPLYDVLNQYLSLPVEVKTSHGVQLRTCMPFIKAGVLVNEITTNDPDHPVWPGDSVRYGMRRYREKPEAFIAK